MADMLVPPLFVPEGHIDKALNHTLIAYRQDFNTLVNRKQGASGVANEMKLQWEKFGVTRRVIGMVDNDKKIFNIAYLSEFSLEVKRFEAPEASHSVRQHPTRQSQFLIMLDPACDTWIWQAAVGAGLVLAGYDLPTDRREFVSYCKDKGIVLDPQMLQLLTDIKRANPALYADLAQFIAQVMDLAHPLA